ncbi:TonB-dependent receptor [Flavobacterium sp. CYK-4]|uniref:TonB-dependent receptor n=1 Tax=Flavobacterium lotistagni TaxID=2709660 RepID=UPI00140847D7|nr:TonB-dependent receptor [Flavobacterium lotistagni]NHM06586.1 TonB-dependent receptor [Flavobacterium lotistagni]
MKLYLLIISLFCCSFIQAQHSVSGKVTDSNMQPIPGANVRVAGDSAGTTSDADGNFKLDTAAKLPFTLEVTMVGYQKQSLSISSNAQKVSVSLESEETKLNEIVVSASRTPERILESPVTIERMGLKDIKATSSATFYEGLENMKEVHFNTGSLNFKSINTRGFATIANNRFMQLVDGMDNSSPALNFVLGNLVGLSDLDVASVELLPGASSALYGAGAFNGILFMNSKSPFVYQGISFYGKYGQTSQEVAGTNDYYDFGVRAAHKFNDYVAGKANFTFMKATEWIAADTRSMSGGTIGHENNPNYDGLNTYGDEVTNFIPNVGPVSRTGYREQDLNDNKVENVKADFSLHVKPWKNDFEVILQHKVGIGNTTYQGANRYRLENFIMQQSKIEFKNKNFFLRGYMTTEDAGDSYDMRFAAWNVNRAAKSDAGWYRDYVTAYLQSQIGLGFTGTQAAQYARNFADNNVTAVPNLGDNPLNLAPSGLPRFQVGTPEYNNALARIVQDPDFTKGAKFIDQSRIYHSDLNYNFKDQIKFAEFQLGGSYRQYSLDSEGSIFTDYDGAINYTEIGAYVQMQKKVLNDRLKLTGSVRYDKSEFFNGFVSPRVSLVYAAGANKNHVFRTSFQTGFRNPTTQDLFIGLDLGPFALIGSQEDNPSRYSETLPTSAAGIALGQPAEVTFSGLDAYTRPAFTDPSIKLFAVTQNTADLKLADKPSYVKPEQVKAFELGYKTVLENGLSFDINGYYNIYNDFLSTSRLVIPYYGVAQENLPLSDLAVQAIRNRDVRTFQVYSNSSTEIKSLGFGAGVSKKVYKDFELGINYNHAQFEFDQERDPSFIAGFNTPKHRVKASLGNEKLFKNFGFNINARWSSEYLWQSSFADGTIPEVTVFDAQINYSIPAIKSVIKLSGSNIGADDYLQVIGAGRIGQLYLISWTINP